MEEQAQKHPGGRPTDYDPKYCDLFVEEGKKGLAIQEICAKIGVLRKTAINWTKKYPEFLHAYTRARELAAAYLMEEARNNLGNKCFQPQLWNYMMRFLHNYRDHGVHELHGFVAGMNAKEQADCVIENALGGRLTAQDAELLIRAIAGRENMKVGDLEQKLKDLEVAIESYAVKA